jgi:hypothetical protein
MKVDMKKKSMVDVLVVSIVEMLTCFLCVSNDNAPIEALERFLSFDHVNKLLTNKLGHTTSGIRNEKIIIIPLVTRLYMTSRAYYATFQGSLNCRNLMKFPTKRT